MQRGLLLWTYWIFWSFIWMMVRLIRVEEWNCCMYGIHNVTIRIIWHYTFYIHSYVLIISKRWTGWVKRLKRPPKSFFFNWMLSNYFKIAFDSRHALFWLIQLISKYASHYLNTLLNELIYFLNIVWNTDFVFFDNM